MGRLSLIVVLDQFPRGLFAGTPKAYATDPDALRIAEEGLRNGHYDALTKPWEKTFFLCRSPTRRDRSTWSGWSAPWPWSRRSP